MVLATTTTTVTQTALEPGTLRVLSPLEQHGVKLGEAIFQRKRKDANELVSVYYGKHHKEDVVVKIFHKKNATIKTGRSENEINALKRLTELSCEHAPRLIKEFQIPAKAGGLDQYVIMSKLPGFDLDEDDKWDHLEQKMRGYFSTAQKAVLNCGVDNGSHRTRNIMYDPDEKKCYIVDFERATMADSWKGSDHGTDLDLWT